MSDNSYEKIDDRHCEHNDHRELGWRGRGLACVKLRYSSSGRHWHCVIGWLSWCSRCDCRGCGRIERKEREKRRCGTWRVWATDTVCREIGTLHRICSTFGRIACSRSGASQFLSSSIFLFSAAESISIGNRWNGEEDFVTRSEALSYGVMKSRAEVSSIALRVYALEDRLVNLSNDHGNVPEQNLGEGPTFW